MIVSANLNAETDLMHVTLLGTGAPLSPGRCTMGMLVTAPSCEPLLIDTCGGFELARQLVAAGFKLTDVTNVIITHRHMDHAGGMSALLLAQRPCVVYALPDTHEGLALMKAGAFPEWGEDNPDWGANAARFRHDVSPGETRAIGGFQVEFFAMVHRVPTVAVRVTHDGRTLTYSADGRPCEALVAAARGADLFICDAFVAEREDDKHAERARQLMHPTAKEAGEIARAAGAKVLACVHTARFANPELILAEAHAAFAGPTLLPSDLDRIAV